MSVYEKVTAGLKSAGLDLESLLSEGGVNTTGVINITKSTDGNILAIIQPQSDTAVCIAGMQITMDKVSFLVDEDVAIDWDLSKAKLGE